MNISEKIYICRIVVIKFKISTMRNIFFLLLSLILLTSCNSSSGGGNSLKGKVVCILTEYQGGGYSSTRITEYNNKTIKRILSVYSLNGNLISFSEFIYNYSGEKLISIEANSESGREMIPPDKFNDHESGLDLALGNEYFISDSDNKIFYKYDEKGNWIERRVTKEFSSGESTLIQSRKIYYEGEDYSNLISEFISSIQSLNTNYH